MVKYSKQSNVKKNRRNHVMTTPQPISPLSAEFPSQRFSVLDYGARADGHTLNTGAFRAAIEACHNAGGGHVDVPDGCYITGPIQLLSNVDLHLSDNAYILFSRNYDDYPLIYSYYEGYPSVRCTSPLWATDAENIAVTGGGVLDGGGEAWWYVRRWEQTDEMWNYILRWRGGCDDPDPKRHVWWPTERHREGNRYFSEHSGLVSDLAEAEKYKPFFRPCMVELIRCRRILLRGVTVQNSPAWSIHPFLCEHITVENVTVKAPWDAPNTDGLNFECSKYARVQHCTFDVGDDAICMKAGKNAAGRRIGVSTDNVYVGNCRVYAAHGGFVLGTETACGIHDVLVENCIFCKTDQGLRFKSCYGRGGVIENITMRHIRMHGIIKDAISFIMSRDLAAMPADTPRNPDGSFQYSPDDMPLFRNIAIEDVHCFGALSALLVRGLPGIGIENIHISDAWLEAKQGISSEGADSILLDRVTVLNERSPLEQRRFDGLLLSRDAFTYAFEQPGK